MLIDECTSHEWEKKKKGLTYFNYFMDQLKCFSFQYALHSRLQVILLKLILYPYYANINVMFYMSCCYASLKINFTFSFNIEHYAVFIIIV